ncbi:CrcB family protein [Nesterenkonia populi]|uniref:CrcB family protein n=1 Tax=Nesterenkonia populi TaxID=1591087 RepID=UPI0011BEC650|nr:CrcB family protein [Nesterenkonia populi]
MSGVVVLGVAAGGAVGAVSRYLLDRFLPGGLLAANVLGCFGLGLLYGLLVSAAGPGQPTTTILAAGLLGALTTFATVSLRSAQLWLDGSRWAAAGLWLAHAGAGFAAAAAGLLLTA